MSSTFWRRASHAGKRRRVDARERRARVCTPRSSSSSEGEVLAVHVAFVVENSLSLLQPITGAPDLAL